MTAKSKALDKAKGGDKKIVVKGRTLAKKEKNDEGKTKIGNYAYKKLESRSKKVGYYVQGHKNYGDVYEA